MRNQSKQPKYQSKIQEGVREAESAVVTVREKTAKEKEHIKEAFMAHFLFRSLDAKMKSKVIDLMKHFRMQQNEVVFNQGLPGIHFFIVIGGTLRIEVNGIQKGKLQMGDHFGELALIGEAERSCTIITKTQVELWGLDQFSFQQVLSSINQLYYEENKKFIDSVPLFTILTNSEKEWLVSSLSSHKFIKDDAIVKEGDSGDLFFIIKEGVVSCTQNSQEIRRMFKGDFFGEQALLYNWLRTATITAITEVECLSLNRFALDEVLGNHLQQIIYRNSLKISMEQSATLRWLDLDQIKAVIEQIRVKSYQQGECVIEQHVLKNSALYVIVKGEVQASSTLVLNKFHVLGDDVIAKDTADPYVTNITALEDTEIGYISKEQFEACIGGNLKLVKSQNAVRQVLRRVPLFRNLARGNFEKLSKAVVQNKFTDEYIFHENDPGDIFYIVKEGNVDIIKGENLLRTITKNDFFGERAVLLKENRSASVYANGSVHVWELSKQDFLQIIDSSVQKLLLQRIELNDDSVTIDDLSVIKCLGSGTFGTVHLCMHKRKQTLYAVKSVSRTKIAKHKLHDNLISEREILLKIDHPNIMKLVKTWKDGDRVYFITEYIPGEEMFNSIRAQPLLSDEDSKFYIGNLLLALEHLAELNICHRDLKPENCMVDVDGYPKLIDFGTAKIVKGRAYSVLGTPHYMAPEVLLGRGYDFSADLWALGIMLYEFIWGGVPFGDSYQDPYKVYEAILAGHIKYPKCVKAKHPARKIIGLMVNRNPSARGSATMLMKSKWFAEFNWDNLINRLVQPNYKPEIDRVDTSKPMRQTLQQILIREDLKKQESTTQTSPSGWDVNF